MIYRVSGSQSLYVGAFDVDVQAQFHCMLENTSLLPNVTQMESPSILNLSTSYNFFSFLDELVTFRIQNCNLSICWSIWIPASTEFYEDDSARGPITLGKSPSSDESLRQWSQY